MEELTIHKFLSGSGSGDGDGSGSGDGDGYGYGDGDRFGYGDGYGSGSGDGSGYGDGSGSGYGDGSGSGSGSGYGYGYGDGSGSGSGSGSGDGDGYGSGDGSGYGYGDGYGDGIKLQTHSGSPVHYIDTLPCVIRSIKGEVAKVDVIDINTFSSTPMFVAKHGDLFAHGKTIKEAMESVQEKWTESRSIEDRIEEFKTNFKNGVKYEASLFYKWHTILTGSCQSGKDFWIQQQGIDLKKTMTVQEFCSLTLNFYGGEIIRRLSDLYK